MHNPSHLTSSSRVYKRILSKKAVAFHAQSALLRAQRLCVLSAHPTVLATAERLVRLGEVKARDVIMLSSRMKDLDSTTLEIARAFALSLHSTTLYHSLQSNATVGGLVRARAAGTRFIWRERSPQAFSDSLTGAPPTP